MASETAKGKKQTVQFYVDDPMLSHIDEKANDKFLKWLNHESGKHAEMTLTRCEEHKRLSVEFTLGDGEFTLNVTRKVKKF